MRVIFKFFAFAVSIYSYALLAYLILTFVLPNHQITKFLKDISEPFLTPVRNTLFKWIPALRDLPFDITPIAAFFLLGIV
ncbi:MAG: YggT family protein, partial [Christensenellaceae bacterium]|nr:YggT family protein [Christensenellaceae bacterium]